MTDDRNRLRVMTDATDEATSAECLKVLDAMESRIARARLEGLAGVFFGLITLEGVATFIGAGDVPDILDQAVEMLIDESEGEDVNVDI